MKFSVLFLGRRKSQRYNDIPELYRAMVNNIVLGEIIQERHTLPKERSAWLNLEEENKFLIPQAFTHMENTRVLKLSLKYKYPFKAITAIF